VLVSLSVMSYVPERGYESDEFDGFDFGDGVREDFGIQVIKEPTSLTPNTPVKQEEPINNGCKLQEINYAEANLAAENSSEKFFIGSDSPEHDKVSTEMPNLEQVTEPIVISPKPKPFQKQGRFSPHLPSSRSRFGSKSSQNYKFKPAGDPRERSGDAQAQSMLMERGEELRLAISRGDLDKVALILDTGKSKHLNSYIASTY